MRVDSSLEVAAGGWQQLWDQPLAFPGAKVGQSYRELERKCAHL